MKTLKDIINTAKIQFAADFNCNVSDFDKPNNTITENKLIEGRRIYQSDGCFLKILCFCGKAIFTADQRMIPWLGERLVNASADWLFQFPKLRAIDRKLNEFGHELADVHHYFLPNPKLPAVQPLYPIRWFERDELLQFKDDSRFGEALAFDETHPDVLAVAAYDGENIMGMAGASADSETMWQIGIDVIPEYRGRGLGSNLTALLKQEVLKRGKVPFYGTAESHIFSQNVAINAGFVPAWSEAFSKQMNI